MYTVPRCRQYPLGPSLAPLPPIGHIKSFGRMSPQGHSRHSHHPGMSGSPQERTFGHRGQSGPQPAIAGAALLGQHARGVVSFPLRTSRGRGV
jgi:hypothetical protein